MAITWLCIFFWTTVVAAHSQLHIFQHALSFFRFLMFTSNLEIAYRDEQQFLPESITACEVGVTLICYIPCAEAKLV